METNVKSYYLTKFCLICFALNQVEIESPPAEFFGSFNLGFDGTSHPNLGFDGTSHPNLGFDGSPHPNPKSPYRSLVRAHLGKKTGK